MKSTLYIRGNPRLMLSKFEPFEFQVRDVIDRIRKPSLLRSDPSRKKKASSTWQKERERRRVRISVAGNRDNYFVLCILRVRDHVSEDIEIDWLSSRERNGIFIGRTKVSR